MGLLWQLHGAWDYLEKPTSAKTIIRTVERAIQYRQQQYKRERNLKLDREAIVGESIAIQNSLQLLYKAAGSDIATLLTGESGTGKELFAWTIHHSSKRAGENFIVVDCTSLPETLIEGILFGCEKGVYTGADRNREGLIAQANGGTLFLDEVGDMPLLIWSMVISNSFQVISILWMNDDGRFDKGNSIFRSVCQISKDIGKYTPVTIVLNFMEGI